ncbi:MAG: lipopolysaccharide assembly protein LapB [Gammaproteobacteria bacterium]|nr:lipopolysaccharide assembly protein LapB [Gammaproteobacteria bacterium]
MSNDWSQALILLLVGVALGIWITFRLVVGHRQRRERRLTRDYYKGLNYLLNEQPDKALDVFIRLMSVDNETIETHYALGALFRRRGEIDRAIRIHQNLIARPSLQTEQRQHALYELAQDYSRAGLYDRAERLFHEIVDVPDLSDQVLQQLALLYELQRDWQHAIEARRRLKVRGVEDQDAIMAHYYCELAEESLRQGQINQTRDHLKKAKTNRSRSLRSLLIQAELDSQKDDIKSAIKDYKQVFEREPRLVVMVFPKLLATLARTNYTGRLWDDWQVFLTKNPTLQAYLAQAALVHENVTLDWLHPYLRDFLRQQTSLMELARSLSAEQSVQLESPQILIQIAQLLSHLIRHQSTYSCDQCGYASHVFYWQCPSCKAWDTTHSLQSINNDDWAAQALRAA